MNNSYQGGTVRATESGVETTQLYNGTKEEMQTKFEAVEIGQRYGSSGQFISSATLSQKSGPIWELSIVTMDQSQGNGSFSNAPNTAYGQRSATLDASMMSMPLESLSKYKRNWDHYLIAGIKSGETLTLPEWWATAKADHIMESADSQKYRWIKEASQCPIGVDSNGRAWYIMKNPTKPGVSYVDKAVYRITEKIRCHSAKEAGTYACNMANKIVAPHETFGLAKGSMWKCDSVSVSWNGDDWIASLSYAMAGNAEGWDDDLYGEGD